MILNTYLKGDTFGCFGGGFTGFCLFKMGVRQKKFKLKQINMDLKEIQNLIKFVANSGVAEVKLKWMILKSPLELL
jgi:hypothetical protein